MRKCEKKKKKKSTFSFLFIICVSNGAMEKPFYQINTSPN